MGPQGLRKDCGRWVGSSPCGRSEPEAVSGVAPGFRNTTESFEMNRLRVQQLLGVALGVLLGYLAATGKLNPFQKAEAASPPSSTVATGPDGSAACCPEGAAQAQLVAMTNPKVKEAVSRVEAQGK